MSEAKPFSDEIKFWQGKFRGLLDWDIIYVQPKDTKERQWVNYCLKTKTASINPYGEIGEKVPDNYIPHEILHLAIKSLQGDREKEELFVQDVCEIISQSARCRAALEDVKRANQSVRESIKKGCNINIVLDATDKFITEALEAPHEKA